LDGGMRAMPTFSGLAASLGGFAFAATFSLLTADVRFALVSILPRLWLASSSTPPPERRGGFAPYLAASEEPCKSPMLLHGPGDQATRVRVARNRTRSVDAVRLNRVLGQ